MLKPLIRTTLWSCMLIAPLAAQTAANGTATPPPHLRLRFASFDPVEDVHLAPPSLRSSHQQTMHIVQFVAPPTNADRASLHGAHASIVSYLPDHAYVVRTAAANLTAVRAIATVRWVGAYHPAYRIDPALLTSGALRSTSPTTYNIIVADKHRDKPSLLAAIVSIGGEVAPRHEGSVRIVATLTGAQLLHVLHRDEVLWVDRTTPIGLDMDNARIQGGANYVELQGGYTGTGVNAHVHEGLEATHVDFTGPVTNVASAGGVSFHGHAVAGILFGNGTSNPAVRGMADDCGKFFTEWQTQTTSRWQLVSDLVNVHDVSHTTASWGNAITFYYTSISAEADDIVFDHDIAWTQAHGNSSVQSRPQAWAKNVFTIGGVTHLDDSNPANDTCGFATGPASDGRIKPTLVAYADSVGTSDLTGAAGFSPLDWFANFGGTSASTPMVAGHNVLAIEMFTDEVTPGFGLFGNPLRTPGGTAHENRPHFPTLKALMVAGAAQYSIAAGNGRACQGWGFPDLRELHDRRASMFIVDETDVLTAGQTRSWNIEVANNEPSLKVSLNWNEPGANPAAAAQRINDLSLRVTSPSGQSYWGNHGLGGAVWSSTGGSVDSVNTIENVFVQNPTAGTWTVEVIASAIVMDNHVETAAVDADYGLVVIGGTSTYATVSSVGAGCAGVSLAASARPVLGTTFDLTTTGAPTNSVLGLSILSLTELTPALDLTFLGMPTCELYQNLDLLTQFAMVSGSGTSPLSLPASTTLIGTVLHTQSATFSPGINPFGFATSNGLVLTTDIH